MRLNNFSLYLLISFFLDNSCLYNSHLLLRRRYIVSLSFFIYIWFVENVALSWNRHFFWVRNIISNRNRWLSVNWSFRFCVWYYWSLNRKRLLVWSSIDWSYWLHITGPHYWTRWINHFRLPDFSHNLWSVLIASIDFDWSGLSLIGISLAYEYIRIWVSIDVHQIQIKIITCQFFTLIQEYLRISYFLIKSHEDI